MRWGVSVNVAGMADVVAPTFSSSLSLSSLAFSSSHSLSSSCVILPLFAARSFLRRSYLRLAFSF